MFKLLRTLKVMTLAQVTLTYGGALAPHSGQYNTVVQTPARRIVGWGFDPSAGGIVP